MGLATRLARPRIRVKKLLQRDGCHVDGQQLNGFNVHNLGFLKLLLLNVVYLFPVARGTSAKPSEGFFRLAELPRSRPKDFSLSRDFREAARAVRHARGTSASVAGGGRESLWFDFVFIS